MTTDRKCPLCSAPLTRAPKESAAEFAVRQFCSRQCASRSKGARFDALLRPKLVREERPDVPRKNCQECGGVLVLHYYANGHRESAVKFAARNFCGRSCAMRYRTAHTAPMPAPQPDVRTTPGTGLAVIPKKKKQAMPTVDPALCTFPAKAIWHADGRAVAEGLHASGATVEILVRGWASTVDEDADGYVTPLFQTAGAAALWDSIADYRLGRREGKAA